jgi:hypothetical protein
MDNVANRAQTRAGVYDLLATVFREPLAAGRGTGRGTFIVRKLLIRCNRVADSDQ